MTNPNNAVGTNAAYGGRTSVNAFNDWANFYSRGIVSGWIGAPSSGMTIQFGGLAGVRDVALAEDPNGNKTTVNNTTTSPVPVTIAAASTTSNRQDVVVAYVNSPAEVSTTTVDNPGACGIIAVSGSASSTPNDSAIRAAITSDGGTGTTAYYVILAVVAVSANTTTITSEMILQNGLYAQVAPVNILPDQSITSDKIDFATQKPNGDIVIQLNGVQIVSMRRSFDVNINNPWGSWYDAVVGYFDYPEPFDDLPVVTVTAVAFDFGVLVEYVGDSGGSQPIATNSHTGQIGLARATAANDVTGYLCITAIGPKG